MSIGFGRILGERTYTAYRFPDRVVQGGVFRDEQGEGVQTFSVRGTVTTLKDSDLASLDDFVRSAARFKFFTRHGSKLREYKQGMPHVPDILEYNGGRYWVAAVRDNSTALVGSPLNHRRYVLIEARERL